MTRRRQDKPQGPRPNHRRDREISEGRPKKGRARRLLRGIGKCAAFIAVCIGIVWGGVLAWQRGGPWLAEALRVNEIFVSGTTHVTRPEVIAKLQLDKRATLYGLDTKPLIDRVKTLTWVKEATITRVPFHALEVEIVERRPAGVVQGVHANVLVDDEGVILKWIGQTTDGRLPLVTGVDIKRMSQPESRERRTVKEAFELASLIRQAEEQRVQVDGTNPMNLVVSVNETRVSFGRSPFHDKWTLYQQLKPVLVAEHGASLAQRPVDVDLRFLDRVIVRERG